MWRCEIGSRERARAAVPRERAADRARDRFAHAVIVFVDGEGYPLSVATDFRVDPERGDRADAGCRANFQDRSLRGQIARQIAPSKFILQLMLV